MITREDYETLRGLNDPLLRRLVEAYVPCNSEALSLSYTPTREALEAYRTLGRYVFGARFGLDEPRTPIEFAYIRVWNDASDALHRAETPLRLKLALTTVILCLLLVTLSWAVSYTRLKADLQNLRARISTVECSPVFNAPEPPSATVDPQPTPVDSL